MRNETFKFEAAECRRQAATIFEGRSEKDLLLRLAKAFEELAREPVRTPSKVSGFAGSNASPTNE